MLLIPRIPSIVGECDVPASFHCHLTKLSSVLAPQCIPLVLSGISSVVLDFIGTHQRSFDDIRTAWNASTDDHPTPHVQQLFPY